MSIFGIFLQVIVIMTYSTLILSILRILLKAQQFLILSHSQDSLKKDPNETLDTRREPLNLVGMIVLLLFSWIIFQIKVGFRLEGKPGDLPAIVLGTIPVIILILLVLINTIQYLRGKQKVRRYGVITEQISLSTRSKWKIELTRKIYHLIAIAITVCALFGAYLFVRFQAQVTPSTPVSEYYQTLYETFWGSRDGLDYLYLVFIRITMPLGQTILILFMYGTALVCLTIDLTRLSKRIHFILHKEMQSLMRYKEIDTLASYTHFSVGYLFTSLVLPPILFLSGLILVALADPVASFVGMLWGKHRYAWNAKSIEGTLAGMLVSLLLMVPLVGWIYASAGAVVFGVIDLITPYPIRLSDNLVLPVGITFIFVILSLIGIPFQSFIL